VGEAVSSRPLLLLALASACAGALLGCGGGSRAADGPATVVRLPHGVEPNRLLRAADGSLWVTEGGRAELARLLPDGKLRFYELPGSEIFVDSIAEGPDGMIWLSGNGELFRVQPENGSVAVPKGSGGGGPELGATGALTAGPDEALWYTSAGNPDRIVRVTAGGQVTGFALADSAGEQMEGIALGADGALWFTQAADPVADNPPADAIGRMDTDGNFIRHPLPDRQGDPRRIVAGPGGELWFTEEAGRIGRISTTGKIEEFALPPGVTPTGLTVSGGQVWFCTTHKVGRVARDGRISEWRIDGATDITDIAPDAPHGVWLADGGAGVLRRFSPEGS
jgi:virginiamycin B lyase